MCGHPEDDFLQITYNCINRSPGEYYDAQQRCLLVYSNIVLHISKDVRTILGLQGSDLISSPDAFTGERSVFACEGQEAELKCGKSVSIILSACFYFQK